MLKKNNAVKCGSGDSIVDYLYDEMSAAQRSVFEDHLVDCTLCTDEFAAIADSRYSVYEWQKLEFEPMETPRIVIPYGETKPSWMDAVKSIFATGPRLAGAGAFALLVAAFGFGSLFMSGGDVDVVSAPDLNVTEPSVETRSVPVPETIAQPDKAMQDKAPEYIAVKEQAPKAVQKRRASDKQRAVRSQKIGNETQAKAPRLNDFEELSDDSLRLSDLVADIDTRD